MKRPGPDHPITIEPFPRRVTVRAGGEVIAESERALVLREADYPPVYYLPRDDVAMTALSPSGLRTYCPYKGDASYLSVDSLGEAGRDAVWSYESPYADVAPIAGHLAFYRHRVTIEA